MSSQQFIGKICPYCKTPFVEGDDIVICSQCEMPHHKNCWIENQGCTTFGCSGTIQAANENSWSEGRDHTTEIAHAYVPSSPKQEENSVLYCTRCGKSHDPQDLFCTKCGHQFVYPQETNCPQGRQTTSQYARQQSNSAGGQQQSWDQNIDYETLFIVENVPYYKSKFENIRTFKSSNSWNWPAFLVLPYWCVYRKMYGLGIGLWVGAILLTLIPWFGYIAIIVGRVILAVFANEIYMKRVQTLTLTAQSMIEPHKSAFIKKKGGVSVIGVVIFVCVYLIIAVIAALEV